MPKSASSTAPNYSKAWIPDPEKLRIHLIAVARGASEHATTYWGGGSSGSLFIDTKLVQKDHYSSPFRIGWALPNRRVVHVFDETIQM